ncbi:MAG: hypothetical protein KDC75_06455, partial [Phaeodactylibacter sp.]|nr:hypothetical protein [Phaeodactylibacter sp.]
MKKNLLSFLLTLPLITWGQKPELIVPVGHSKAVTCAAFSPPCPNGMECPPGQEQLLLTGSADKTVKLWNRQGQELRTFKTSSQEENAAVESVAFSSDGSHVIAYSDDGEWGLLAEMWDINGKKTAQFHCRSYQSADFSPACPEGKERPFGNGPLILTGSNNGEIRVWDLKGREISAFPTPSENALADVACSSDEIYVLTLSNGSGPSGGGVARMWN